MYNIKTVNTCLFGSVGFEQTQDVDKYPILEDNLLETRSGLTVQGENPILTPENLFHVIPEQGNPSTKITSAQISTFLRRILKNSINKVLRAVFNADKIKGFTKSIFENVTLFNGAGRINNKIVKEGRFVGFEINLKRFDNLSLSINKIGLQFDTINPALKIYFFHSSQLDNIRIETVATVANSFTWHIPSTEILLQYLDGTIDAGGSFFIGYFEEDLTGQAIKKDVDFRSINICNDCNGGNNNGFELFNKYFDVNAFEVLNSDLNGVQLWDIEKNRFPGFTNFGLNLQLSLNCDLSDFICRNQSLLSNVLSKQIAFDLLHFMSNMVETSGVSEQLKIIAILEIKDSNGRSTAWVKELEKLKLGLNFDYSDLESPCLPCKENGIRYGSN